MRRLSGIDLPYIAKGFEPSMIRRISVDFDGVVSSANRAFYEGIALAVEYYYRAILGLGGAAGRLVSEDEISALKETGLFNNDWDLTRILIAYHLALAYRKLGEKGGEEEFLQMLEGLGRMGQGDPIGGIRGLGEYMRSRGLDLAELAKGKRTFPIKGLASRLGSAGLGGEGALKGLIEFLAPIRGGSHLNRLLGRLVGFDAGEGNDLVKDLFEEIYLGPDLYRRFYGRDPRFGLRAGLISLERPLPTGETLRRLSDRFERLCIYSERSRAQAEYLLEEWGLLEHFDLSRSVFVEEIAGYASSAGVPRSAMGKPNPEPFLKFLASLGEGLSAIYVGDSLSDLYLVGNAKAMGYGGVHFAGVLSDCRDPGAMASAFRNGGASAIMWDLNQLPEVLGA
ncbi:MAG: hypothetical protein QXL35_03820 [Candidatus Bathyarchaeia archaeon]